MLTDVLISSFLLLNLASYPVLHHALDNGLLGTCFEYPQLTLVHSQSEPLGTAVVWVLKLHISMIIVHQAILSFSLLV